MFPDVASCGIKYSYIWKCCHSFHKCQVKTASRTIISGFYCIISLCECTIAKMLTRTGVKIIANAFVFLYVTDMKVVVVGTYITANM